MITVTKMMITMVIKIKTTTKMQEKEMMVMILLIIREFISMTIKVKNIPIQIMEHILSLGICAED